MDLVAIATQQQAEPMVSEPLWWRWKTNAADRDRGLGQAIDGGSVALSREGCDS